MSSDGSEASGSSSSTTAGSARCRKMIPSPSCAAMQTVPSSGGRSNWFRSGGSLAGGCETAGRFCGGLDLIESEEASSAAVPERNETLDLVGVFEKFDVRGDVEQARFGSGAHRVGVPSANLSQDGIAVRGETARQEML